MYACVHSIMAVVWNQLQNGSDNNYKNKRKNTSKNIIEFENKKKKTKKIYKKRKWKSVLKRE